MATELLSPPAAEAATAPETSPLVSPDTRRKAAVASARSYSERMLECSELYLQEAE